MVEVEVLSCCCLWPCNWRQKCIPRSRTCYRRLKALTELFSSLYSASLEVFSFKRWRLTKKSILYALAASFWRRNIKRGVTTLNHHHHHHQDLHDEGIVLYKRCRRTDQRFWTQLKKPGSFGEFHVGGWKEKAQSRSSTTRGSEGMNETENETTDETKVKIIWFELRIDF